MGRAWSLVLLLSCASCLTPVSVVCSDGSTCPENFQCDIEHDRCLTPDELAACVGKLEGEACSLDNRPGGCRSSACELYFCGDGIRTGTEACDGADLSLRSDPTKQATCSDAGFYGAPGLACTDLCTYDTTQCGGGTCGDHTVNGPELCDGDTKRTCIAIGFDAGSLSCNQQCGLSIQQCSRFGWEPESLGDLFALAVGGSSALDEWAVGDGGRAMHYEGAFWTAVPTGVTNSLVAVWSIAPNDVWSVGIGTPSVVLHWDGVAWGTVSAPDVKYVDIWAAGPTAVFAATTDQGVQAWNGTSWSTLGNLSSFRPIAIRGTSSTDLWVATREGPLVHWNGTAWSPAVLPNAAIHFIDANTPDDVWAIGSDAVDLGTGVIAHWNGTAWKQWRTLSDTYNQVASSGPNDTWVIGSDGVMRHFDGTAWSSTMNIGASSTGASAISGLISFGAGEVVAVSTLNLAYRYGGQVFGVFPSIERDHLLAAQNTAIWGLTADDIYVTNVKGQVVHFDGVAWSIAFTVPESNTNPVGASSVWGTSSTDVWVGAADGRVYHFDGANWDGEDVAPGGPIEKLWGSGTDVWAFGTFGAFHRTGSGWVHFGLGTKSIRSVSGSGPSDIYVVEAGFADANLLWHWNGTAWAVVTTAATSPITAVVALAPDSVFVAGKAGRIEQWNGTVWSETIVPAVAELTMMTATAQDDVIAASQRELFHFDGVAWSPMRTPVDFIPNSPDYIPMTAIQASPGRIDMLLERFRVRTLIRTQAIACRPVETNCADAVDDDCDGTIDALDSDCP